MYWNEFAASFTTLESNIFSGLGGAYDCVYCDSHGVLKYLESYTVLLHEQFIGSDGTRPFVSPLYRPGLNRPRSTAHEYLSFSCLLSPSIEGS